MSLTLLTTTLLTRLRLRGRSWMPTARPRAPRRERPWQQRDRLRTQVVARGGTPQEIETISGDCPTQTAQQIHDLTRWLAQRE